LWDVGGRREAERQLAKRQVLSHRGRQAGRQVRIGGEMVADCGR